jgi:hypothetical protein
MLRLLYLESMPVVLDLELRMAIDVFPCEDGHLRNLLYVSRCCRLSKPIDYGLPIAICVPKGFSLVYLQPLLTF